MIRMRIDINNPLLQELLYTCKSLEKQVMPSTENAVAEGAKIIQRRWFQFGVMS